MRWIIITAQLSWLLLSSCRSGQELVVSSRILDSADLLTPEQEDSLFYFIQQLDVDTGPQIAIVTIPSLNGSDIRGYSMQVANALKLGRDKFDDGILITVAKEDRQLRIEVGRGLEKIIHDDIAEKIIIDNMVPMFRSGDYSNGLRVAVVEMKSLIEQDKQMIGY